MLKSEIKEECKKFSSKGMTKSEMIASMFIFFAAGYGTSTSSISTVLYYLAKHGFHNDVLMLPKHYF